MTAITKAKNLQQHKSRFYLIVDQILAFTSNDVSLRRSDNLSTRTKDIHDLAVKNCRIVKSQKGVKRPTTTHQKWSS